METAKGLGAPNDAGALAAMDRALRCKLRARRLSEAFINRHAEEMVQQAIAEYEGAIARGRKVENPRGWVVSVAYRRAIDELRRELRETDGEDLANMPGTIPGEEPLSPTEEEAIGEILIAELQEVIGRLSSQQRQALGLYYFEERSTRDAAKVLGCGETTLRRRLDSALRVLRERFGIAIPEPGSELAVEIGIAASLSLAGARVVPTGGMLDRLIALGDSLRSAVAFLADRGRGTTARLFASGNWEGISVTTSAPLGKAIGGVCAGTLAACALTGAIGPGVGVDLVGHHDPGRAGPVGPIRARQLGVATPPIDAGGSGAHRLAPQSTGTARASAEPPRTGGSMAAGRQVAREDSPEFGLEVETPQDRGSSMPAQEPSAPATPPTGIANREFGL